MGSETPAWRRPAGVGDPDCPICHGVGFVREELPVGHPNFGKLQVCTCQLAGLQLERAAQMRAQSNTEALAGKTFETFLPEGINPDSDIRASLRFAFDRCRAFAEKPEKWLLLSGTYGCGKTHLAAAIANQALAQGNPVLFEVVPDLLDHLRSAFGPTSDLAYDELFERVRTAGLLILDDLGTENTTPWAREKLYQIVNYRYNYRQPTVITTNRRLTDIDDRIRSRMTDAAFCVLVEVNAADYRQRKPGERRRPDIGRIK